MGGQATQTTRPALQASTPARLARDGDIVYTVAEQRQRGVYEDPTRLVAVRFPEDWRVVRKIDHGEISYILSSEAGQTPPS